MAELLVETPDGEIRPVYKKSIIREMIEKLEQALYPLGAILMVLILWWTGVRIFKIGSYLLPSPEMVFRTLFIRRDILFRQSMFTLQETLFGFGLAVIIGVLLAIAIVYSPFFEKTVYPILVIAQSMPKTALAPLFLVWFGFGQLPKVAIAFLIAVFPVIINSVVGMSSIDPDMIRLARSMGASGYRIFWKMRLPYALPTMFAGFKVATTLAIVGAIVGEFVGADVGLGYLLMRTLRLMDTSLTFSAIFCCMALGILLFLLVQTLESLLIPWHVSKRQETVTTTM
jgi:NitT/TauT family transport system permease protein